MKITDVRVVLVNKFLFVRVFTDEGISGIGESGDWGFLESSGEVIKSFREYLIGQDPLRIEHHYVPLLPFPGSGGDGRFKRY